METSPIKKTIFRLFLGLLAVVILTGCPGGSMIDSLSYPKTQPKPQDLVGLYVPDAATLEDILDRGHYPKRDDITIRLSADGTVTCKNIPDWWTNNFGEPSGTFLNKAGTWKVLPREDWWELGFDFGSSKHFIASTNQLALVGQKPPYTLRILLGDPDQGKGMDFAKRE